MMKKLVVLLSLFLCMSSGTLQAQGLLRKVGALRKTVKLAPRSVRTKLARASAARVVKNTSVLAVPEVKEASLAQRLQASLNRTFLRAAPFPANTAFDLQARKSTAIFLLPIYENNPMYGGTAFFIEEEFEGKKYIWGVTAAHWSGSLQKTANIVFSPKLGKRLTFSADIVMRGATGRTDVLLFSVPESFWHYIRPLRLAEKTSRWGEKVRSYGFFNGSFHVTENRQIFRSGPGRVVTSLEFGKVDRNGACGGPLLNAQNEVVGVHCGSSDTQGVSYAIPVEQVHDLLDAYRHNGIHLRTLRYNGIPVGEINVNEYLFSVRLFQGSVLLTSKLIKSPTIPVSYEHLENFVNHPNADRIELTVVRESAYNEKYYMRKESRFIITCNLKNQKTTKMIDTDLSPTGKK